ncbi:MAG: hypothetical protein IBJ00_00870 [Alphaproteobacteria bacterium]|nr:hypothetical protein [Alphaproteobacteria bacterium]
MIKRGIYHTSQLENFQNLKGFFSGKKRLSITLYDQIINHPDAEGLAERILLYFADERGAYKRTYAKRFEAFDIEILKLLSQQLKSQESLVIQDVAVSDGRTACDFFEKLTEYFSNVSYFASDYNPKVYVIEKESTRITLSHTGKILEIVWPPFVFNSIKEENCIYYPVNYLVRRFVLYFVVPPLMKAYHAGELKVRELSLFAHKALILAQNDKRFHLLQHDLLNAFTNQSHLIRAMNVLNPSYFSQDQFEKVLSHIYTGLCKDGLLITGSNQEAGSIVHGGVYQKMPSGFRKIWQSGAGSPIEKKLLEFKPS